MIPWETVLYSRGKTKLTSFPRDHKLSALLYIQTFTHSTVSSRLNWRELFRSTPGSSPESVCTGIFTSYPRSLEGSKFTFTLASLENPRKLFYIETKWYTLNKMTSKYNQQFLFLEFLSSQKKEFCWNDFEIADIQVIWQHEQDECSEQMKQFIIQQKKINFAILEHPVGRC